ncbi:MAG: SDR family NAD(P)-dependent oxidoreductase [Nitrospinota bacterium]|jgi:NAD(P)-dependent dehydrogenase (short-subunit alcohol dehydrogenase family)|nr:SDR family NAD(P)-dependent oxidoreductase [Nitrospinota bacterium]HJM42463.1 SDR family NAD(P)-dependent oxidoreductase [Nitrospinota bacterium]
MELEGKVAIVTGGGRGIGRATAKVMAREGAAVTLAARSLDQLRATAGEIQGAGGRCIVVETDVTSEDSVNRMAKETLEAFGTIDILVNNSGIAGPTALCEETTIDDWNQTFAVNVIGPFLCCKAVLPVMKAKRWGRVINISSMSGKRPLVRRTPYTSSKMAVMGFTRTLAHEVGEFGITVNSVCPGATAGERIDSVIRNIAEGEGRSEAEVRADFTGPSALKSLVNPEDTAEMAAFLASDRAAHMTAQDINVTAGLVWY